MNCTDEIVLRTEGFSHVVDITGKVERSLGDSGITEGLLSVFVPGSTGTVTTIEYEKGVIEDLREAIERIVPSDISYRHNARWGDGNGFSHVRAALMKPGLTVPVVAGSLTLGTWQQIVFIDFDNRPRTRRLVIKVIGE